MTSCAWCSPERPLVCLDRVALFAYRKLKLFVERYKITEESSDFKLKVHLQVSHVPTILDLSGANPFEISVEVKRLDNDERFWCFQQTALYLSPLTSLIKAC